MAVAIPNLAMPEKELGDTRKYVLFHKLGISRDQAEADLRFCWQFLSRGVQRSVPGFIPWRSADAPRQVTYSNGQFGLVGEVIGAIIAGPLDRSVRQSRMFRCMLPRGYGRYRTSEALWKTLNMGDVNTGIAIQAQIASGPVPPTPKVLR